MPIRWPWSKPAPSALPPPAESALEEARRDPPVDTRPTTAPEHAAEPLVPFEHALAPDRTLQYSIGAPVELDNDGAPVSAVHVAGTPRRLTDEEYASGVSPYRELAPGKVTVEHGTRGVVTAIRRDTVVVMVPRHKVTVTPGALSPREVRYLERLHAGPGGWAFGFDRAQVIPMQLPTERKWGEAQRRSAGTHVAGEFVDAEPMNTAQRTGSFYDEYNLWVEPSGQRHQVRTTTHDRWALQMHGTTANGLLRKGWVRVAPPDAVQVADLAASRALVEDIVLWLFSRFPTRDRVWVETEEDNIAVDRLPTGRIDLSPLRRTAAPADGPRFAAAFAELDRLAQEVERAQRESQAESDWVPGQYVGAWSGAKYDLFRAGVRWADTVLREREIPAKQHKAVEMAARLFARASMPKDMVGWFRKNRDRLALLAEAVNWPERGPPEEGRDDVFPLAGFEVHNTVGATGTALDGMKAVIEGAVRALATLGLSDLASGPLYLVGQVAHRNHAAWYKATDDVVYLRPLVRGSSLEESTRHLVHELGHRYWAKRMPESAKTAWTARHRRVDRAPVTLPALEVGAEISNLVVNRKPAAFGGYEGGKAVILDARDGTKIGAIDRFRFAQWLREVGRLALFPTSYAATDPEEHFAESFSLAAQGKLSGDHLAALEQALGHTKSAAGLEQLPTEELESCRTASTASDLLVEELASGEVTRADVLRRLHDVGLYPTPAQLAKVLKVLEGRSLSYTKDPTIAPALLRALEDIEGTDTEDTEMPAVELLPADVYGADPEVARLFSRETDWPEREVPSDAFAGLVRQPSSAQGPAASEVGRANIRLVLGLADPGEVEVYKDWYLVAHNQAKIIAAEARETYSRRLERAREEGRAEPLLPPSFETVCAVIATLSPGTQWEANLRVARRLVLGATVSGAGGVYPVNVNKALLALRADDPALALTGDVRKVRPFYETLVDPRSSARKAVVDRHMFAIWYGDPAQAQASPSDAVYRQIQNDVRAVAEEAGLTTQAVQAVTWYIWRNRTESSRAELEARERAERERRHLPDSPAGFGRWAPPRLELHDVASRTGQTTANEVAHLKTLNQQLYERATAAGARPSPGREGTLSLGTYGWVWGPSLFGTIGDPQRYREALDEMTARVDQFERRDRRDDATVTFAPRRAHASGRGSLRRLARIYELEYKLARLTDEHEQPLPDRAVRARALWTEELDRLVRAETRAVAETLRWWLEENAAADPENTPRGVADNTNDESWEDVPAEELADLEAAPEPEETDALRLAYGRVQRALERLETSVAASLGERVAALNLAVNAAHSTGTMAEYIYGFGAARELDALSEGPHGGWVQEVRELLRLPRGAGLRPGDTPGEAACVMLYLPHELARFFPPREQDSSDPHFTLAYVPGPLDDVARESILDACAEVAAETAPIDFDLEPGVAWFTSDEEDAEEPEIAHKRPDAAGRAWMTDLHERLVAALRARDVEPAVRDEFKPHATIAYRKSRDAHDLPEIEGTVPARVLEVWGWPETPRFVLGGPTVPPDGRRATVRTWGRTVPGTGSRTDSASPRAPSASSSRGSARATSTSSPTRASTGRTGGTTSSGTRPSTGPASPPAPGTGSTSTETASASSGTGRSPRSSAPPSSPGTGSRSANASGSSASDATRSAARGSASWRLVRASERHDSRAVWRATAGTDSPDLRVIDTRAFLEHVDHIARLITEARDAGQRLDWAGLESVVTALRDRAVRDLAERVKRAQLLAEALPVTSAALLRRPLRELADRVDWGDFVSAAMMRLYREHVSKRGPARTVGPYTAPGLAWSRLFTDRTHPSTEALERQARRTAAGRNKNIERLKAANPGQEALIDRLAAVDRSPKAEHLAALFAWTQAGASLEEVAEAYKALDRYGQHLDSTRRRPIDYPTAKAALDAVAEVSVDPDARPKFRKEDAEYETVYTAPGGEFTIYRVDNKAAACVLGADSDWCSAKWDKEWYEKRLSLGRPYVARFTDGSAVMVRVKDRRLTSAYDKTDTALHAGSEMLRAVVDALASIGVLDSRRIDRFSSAAIAEVHEALVRDLRHYVGWGGRWLFQGRDFVHAPQGTTTPADMADLIIADLDRVGFDWNEATNPLEVAGQALTDTWWTAGNFIRGFRAAEAGDDTAVAWAVALLNAYDRAALDTALWEALTTLEQPAWDPTQRKVAAELRADDARAAEALFQAADPHLNWTDRTVPWLLHAAEAGMTPGELPEALARSVVVGADGDEDYDLDAIPLGRTASRRTAARRRRRKQINRKRRRFVRQHWYLNEHGVGLEADTGGGLREVTLRPGVRVLDMSESALTAWVSGERRVAAATDPDVASLVAAVQSQPEALKALSVSVERILAQVGGQSPFDAVRTEDRLIVLNPKAVEDIPKRAPWLKTSADVDRRVAARDVVALVSAFLQEHRTECASQDGAMGRCMDASRDLWRYLVAEGVEAEMIEANDLVEPFDPDYLHPEWRIWTGDDLRFLSHTVVRVGDKVIDLTARQFDSRAPFPLIESEAAFAARWRRRRPSPWMKDADSLPGGAADDARDADFDPEALADGTEHELEHTDDRALAREIAKDHLVEDPDYYVKLRQVEAATPIFGGPTVEVEGRRYKVSNIWSELGEPDPERHRYLWAVDRETGAVAMWRISDGEEKVSGPAREVRDVAEVRAAGQLNVMSSEAFAQLSAAMARRNDLAVEALAEYARTLGGDYQARVNAAARAFYEERVAPEVERAVAASAAGVEPVGFIYSEALAGRGRSREDQARVQLVGAVLQAKLTPAAVEAYLSETGILDPDGDNQAAYWAVGDIRDEVLRRHATRTAAAAAFRRRANRALRNFVREVGLDPDEAAPLKALDPDGRKGYLNWAMRVARAAASGEAGGFSFEVGEELVQGAERGTFLEHTQRGALVRRPDGSTAELTDPVRARLAPEHQREAVLAFREAVEALADYDRFRVYDWLRPLSELADLPALTEATELAERQWNAEPRKERAEYAVLLDEENRKVIRFDNKDAACTLAGGSTSWCFAKWTTDFWESYKARDQDLYEVALDGERYAVALSADGVMVEVKTAANRDVADENREAIAEALRAAGVKVTSTEAGWEDIEDPEAWRAAGFNAEDAEEWLNHIADATPEMARAWSAAGFDPQATAEFLGAGWDRATARRAVELLPVGDVRALVRDIGGFDVAVLSALLHYGNRRAWLTKVLRLLEDSGPGDVEALLTFSAQAGRLLADAKAAMWAAPLVAAWAERGDNTITLREVFEAMHTDGGTGALLPVVAALVKAGKLRELSAWHAAIADGLDAAWLTHSAKITPEQARTWQQAGIDPSAGDIAEYLFAETPEVAARWRASGVEQPEKWAAFGFTPEDAAVWHAAGWRDPYEARRQRNQQRTHAEPRWWDPDVDSYANAKGDTSATPAAYRANALEFSTLTKAFPDALEQDVAMYGLAVRALGFDAAFQLAKALGLRDAKQAVSQSPLGYTSVHLTPERAAQVVQLALRYREGRRPEVALERAYDEVVLGVGAPV